MAKTFFDNPPSQTGRAEEYLRDLYGYLFTMSNKLNEALMDISIEQMTPETQTVVQKAAGADKEQEAQINQLKEIIVKNAEIAVSYSAVWVNAFFIRRKRVSRPIVPLWSASSFAMLA